MSTNCAQNMNYYIHNTILSLMEYDFVYTLIQKNFNIQQKTGCLLN